MLMFEFRMQMKNEQCQPKNNTRHSWVQRKARPLGYPISGQGLNTI